MVGKIVSWSQTELGKNNKRKCRGIVWSSNGMLLMVGCDDGFVRSVNVLREDVRWEKDDDSTSP